MLTALEEAGLSLLYMHGTSWTAKEQLAAHASGPSTEHPTLHLVAHPLLALPGAGAGDHAAGRPLCRVGLRTLSEQQAGLPCNLSTDSDCATTHLGDMCQQTAHIQLVQYIFERADPSGEVGGCWLPHHRAGDAGLAEGAAAEARGVVGAAAPAAGVPASGTGPLVWPGSFVGKCRSCREAIGDMPWCLVNAARRPGSVTCMALIDTSNFADMCSSAQELGKPSVSDQFWHTDAGGADDAQEAAAEAQEISGVAVPMAGGPASHTGSYVWPELLMRHVQICREACRHEVVPSLLHISAM